MMMKGLKLFCLITLFSTWALAMESSGDILFIDLNSSAPEIDLVAHIIANEGDSQLVIVPSERRISLEDRRRITKIYENILDPATTSISENTACIQDKVVDSIVEECNKQLSTANKARAEIYKLITGRQPETSYDIGQLSSVEFLSDLREALAGPYHFSRVIISGHHDPGNYVSENTPDVERRLYGVLFNDFTAQLAEEELNNQPSLHDVRSLLLLGCWSARYENLTQAWGLVLPQASLKFGFVGAAPHNYNPVNLEILAEVLKVEKDMGNAKTDSELHRYFDRVKKNGRDFAFLVGNKYISQRGIRTENLLNRLP